MQGQCLAGHAWKRGPAALTGLAAIAALALPAVSAQARPRDTDRDGLSNRYELERSRTSPRKADTDGDRLGDRFELRRSRTNPLGRDTDDDGLNDGYEWHRLKTSPRKRDTDGDGVADGLERLMGTNPRRKDATRNLISPAPSSDPQPAGAATPPTGPCDTTVTTAAQITSAADSAANEGKVVCVAAGTYGRISLEGISHPAANKVTLRSAAKHQAVLTAVSFGNAAGLSLVDFRVQGGFEHEADGTTMQAIDFVGNDVGGTRTGAFMLNCKVYDVLIERNRIHDIQDTTEWWTGWGIRLSGSPTSPGCDWRRNVRIRYNTFERIQNDAMDLGAVDGGEIVGNVVRDVNKGQLDPSEHTDALMFWAGSKNFLIKDNRFLDNHDQWLISGDSRGVIAENNLIARGGQWAIQAGEAGSSDAGVHNSVFRNNTVWDTGRSWNDQCSPSALTGTNCMGIVLKGRSTQTNTFDHNLVDSFSGCGFVNAGSYNNIVSRSGCRPNDTRIMPRFADTVDYVPTNVPNDPQGRPVGYRPAPAGHAAQP